MAMILPFSTSLPAEPVQSSRDLIGRDLDARDTTPRKERPKDELASASEKRSREDRKDEKPSNNGDFAAMLNLYVQTAGPSAALSKSTVNSQGSSAASIDTETASVTNTASASIDVTTTPAAGTLPAVKASVNTETEVAASPLPETPQIQAGSPAKATLGADTFVDQPATPSTEQVQSSAIPASTDSALLGNDELPSTVSGALNPFGETPAVTIPESARNAATEFETSGMSLKPSTLFMGETGLNTLPEEQDEVSREIAAVLARESRSENHDGSSPARATSSSLLPATTMVLSNSIPTDRATVLPPAPTADIMLNTDTNARVPEATQSLTSTEERPASDILQPSSQEPTSSRDQPQTHTGKHQSADVNAVSTTSGQSVDFGAIVAGAVRNSVHSTFADSVTAELRQPLSTQVSSAILTHLERNETVESDVLTVRLDPPELGEMVIELSKSKDGMSVRVTAREAVTMDMLLARGAEIEAQLRGEKLDLTRLEFLSPSLMNDNASQQQQRPDHLFDHETQSNRRPERRAVHTVKENHLINGVSESAHALSFRA